MIVKAAHRRPEGPFLRLKSDRLTACTVSPFGTAYHLSPPTSGGTIKAPQISNLFPSVISSGVEKSPRTMLPAVSGDTFPGTLSI